MKKDAVQNERDRISSRKPTQEEMQTGGNTGKNGNDNIFLPLYVLPKLRHINIDKC